jgi:hypothetical protein
MIRGKFYSFFAFFFVLTGAISLVACEPQAPERPREEGATVGEVTDETYQEGWEDEFAGGDQGEEGQVIDEQVVGIEEQDFARGEIEEGEAEIRTRTRVVRTEIEEHSIPTVRVCDEMADLNRMDRDHFMALGLSEQAAASIVDYRDDVGEFASVDQLREVPGVDDEVMSQLEGTVDIVAAPEERFAE